MPVREKPDANGKIIGTIPLGNTFSVVEKQENWIQITDGNTSGYALNQSYLPLKRENIEVTSSKNLKQKTKREFNKPKILREKDRANNLQ